MSAAPSTPPAPAEVDPPGAQRPPAWSLALTITGLLAAALATASYIRFDRPVAAWVEHLPTGIHRAASAVSYAGLAGIYLLPLGVLYLVCAARRWRRWADLAWLAFWSIATSGLAVDVVKWIVARARPTLWLKHHEYGFEFFKWSGAHTGFPSGHSATVGSLCAVLWFTWPRGWPAWLLLALAVVAARVLCGAHYPSDVIVGLYAGVATAFLLRGLLAGRPPWGYPATVAP